MAFPKTGDAMRYDRPQVNLKNSRFSQPNRSSLLRVALMSALMIVVLASGALRAEAAGQLTLTPGSVDFGTVKVGRSRTTSVTMTNSGNATVTVSGDTLTGSGYRVSGISMPLRLRAGAGLTFHVSFTPVKSGASSGQLQFISNASNSTVLVALTGSGTSKTASGSATGYVSATPTTAQFGSVPIGTCNTQGIQLTNTGSASVTISGVTASGSGISVAGMNTPLSIAAGATAQLTVAFQPTAAGNVNGSVGITSNASDSQLSVAVSGTGVSVTRVLTASPASVAFGNVNLSATATRAIALTNSGNSSLTIAGATASGAGISATGVNGGVTLAAGQSTTLAANFAPLVSGNVAGSITIASNATNAPSLAVPVTGTGVSTASHTVALQWQASGSSGVTGYNVYRATSTGGPYTKVTPSALSGISYADSGVSSGTTYYYVVTAVASDGSESTYSNQATAVIP